MGDHRYGTRFWTEIAALYAIGAAAIIAWLQFTSLPQQDVWDALYWIPFTAAIAGWLRWRRTHSKRESAGAAASWGLIGGAIGVCLVILIGGAASAQTVTDGDTIKLNGTIYRLWGIDAPEMKQWCGDYPAGVMAAATLETLTKGNGTIICERKDTDRYGRTVAICRVDGRDLGREMVQLGMAWAFTRYSGDYVADEAQAKADYLGVHARSCLPAWEWRAARKN